MLEMVKLEYDRGAVPVAITGTDLGSGSIADVVQVTVGPLACRPLALAQTGEVLIASCDRDGAATGPTSDVWAHGRVTITTASGGTGIGGVEASIFSDSASISASLNTPVEVPDSTTGDANTTGHQSTAPAATALASLANQVSDFEDELQTMAAEVPLRDVCDRAYELRAESQRVLSSLADYDSRTDGAAMYALALNLTKHVLSAGSDMPVARGTMARCWNADAQCSAVRAGIRKPSDQMRQRASNLEASLVMMLAAWSDSDLEHVASIAPTVQERTLTLVSLEPLASSLADAAGRAEGIVSTLVDGLPTSSGDDKPWQGLRVGAGISIGGKGACKLVTALDTLATRCKAAIPQLQYVARPLGRILVHAEDVMSTATKINSTINDPKVIKGFISGLVVNLTDLVTALPLSHVPNATKWLIGLGDTAFDKVEVLVDKIFDFLEKLLERLEGIAQFLVGKFARLLDQIGIEDAIKDIQEAMNTKTTCELMGQIKRFAVLAERVIGAFVPEGGMKDKLIALVEKVRLVSEPSELLEHFIEPALRFLERVGDMDGAANSTELAFAPVLRNWTQDWVVDKLRGLKERGENEVHRLVQVGLNATEEMVAQLANRVGQFGVDLFDEIMPDWIKELVDEITSWIKHAYQTLRFVHQLVNNTDPILTLLDKPRVLKHAVCAPEVDSCVDDAPPDLRGVRSATAGLFGAEGVTGIKAVLPTLDSAARIAECHADVECSQTFATALTSAVVHLNVFDERQAAVGELEPFVCCNAMQGTAEALRMNRAGPFYEMLAQFWRSLTQPGGFLYKLQRALCRGEYVKSRTDWEFEEPNPLPYHVPDWLAPHLCNAATWARNVADDANAWINDRADDLWALILRACEWAASILEQVQEWAQDTMGQLEHGLQAVKEKAGWLLNEVLLPVSDALATVDNFIDAAEVAVDDAQSVIDGAREALTFVQAVNNASEHVALPSWLGSGKTMDALQVALEAAVSTSTAQDCNAAYPPSHVLSVLQTTWQDIRGFAAELSDGVQIGEIAAIPAHLLKAFGGAVCFTKMAAASAMFYVDEGVDLVHTFLTALSLGDWAEPSPPDCSVLPSHFRYFCLVPKRRSTDFYRAFRFPVGHIQFWDLTSPPLFNVATMTALDGGDGGEMAFKFTIPGLVSKYALQSSTFLQIEHTVLGGFVPRRYVLGYRPMEGRAPIGCNSTDYSSRRNDTFMGCEATNTTNRCRIVGRASLLATTDGFGAVNAVHEIYVNGDPYSGSITGLAASADDQVKSVWACSQHDDHLPWQILRFDYDAVMDTNAAIVHATIQRDGLGWLSGAKRCTLTHAPGMNLDPDYLWVGSVVEQTPSSTNGYHYSDDGHESDNGAGEARAYKVWPRDEYADIYTQQVGGGLGDGSGSDSLHATPYGELLLECNDADYAHGGCATEFVGGPYYGARLLYGERVQGFAFFENKFDVPHVAIARCGFGSSQPCSLEMHFLVDSEWELDTPVPYPNTLKQPTHNLDDSFWGDENGAHRMDYVDGEMKEKCSREFRTSHGGCTLSTALKIPPGIGSLAHDSSMRAIPHQYFHVGFIGTTTEYLNETRKHKADPEDRIFLMRAPILQNQRPTVTRNWIQCRILGFDLFEPGVLIRFKNADGSDQPPVAQDPDEGTEMEWDYDRRDRQRRLSSRSSSRAVDAGLRSALGDSRGGDAALLFGGVGKRGLSTRRRRLSLGEEDAGCFQASKQLMEAYVWKPFLHVQEQFYDGFFTDPCIPVWAAPPVTLCGAITAHAVVTLNLAGEVCLASKSIKVSLIPAVTIKVIAAVYLNLRIISAGLDAAADLLTLQLEPELYISLMDGFDAGFNLWLAKPKNRVSHPPARPAASKRFRALSSRTPAPSHLRRLHLQSCDPTQTRNS